MTDSSLWAAFVRVSPFRGPAVVVVVALALQPLQHHRLPHCSSRRAALWRWMNALTARSIAMRLLLQLLFLLALHFLWL